MSSLVSCSRCKSLRHLINSNLFKFFRTFQPVFTEIKRRSSSESLLEVNTNVIKDVLLYKNENTRQIKMLNYFALGQFIFWNYLAETAFTTLKDTSSDEYDIDAPWYKRINLGAVSMRYSLTGLCLVLG